MKRLLLILLVLLPFLVRGQNASWRFFDRYTKAEGFTSIQLERKMMRMMSRQAAEKGDALLREYAQTLIEYIEHYLRFEGAQGDMVSGLIDEKLDQLGDVYYLASYAGRREVLAELNTYYRSLGVSEENLIDAGDKPQQPDSARLRSGI